MHQSDRIDKFSFFVLFVCNIHQIVCEWFVGGPREAKLYEIVSEKTRCIFYPYKFAMLLVICVNDIESSIIICPWSTSMIHIWSSMLWMGSKQFFHHLKYLDSAVVCALILQDWKKWDQLWEGISWCFTSFLAKTVCFADCWFSLAFYVYVNLIWLLVCLIFSQVWLQAHVNCGCGSSGFSSDCNL